MKPRLRKDRGVWICGILIPQGVFSFPVGHGYTPEEAFNDWLEQRSDS